MRPRKRDTLRPSFLLIAEQSLKAITRRPGRALATATGVALGVAVFITSLGFAQTVNAEVNASFDATTATQIRVKDSASSPKDGLFSGFSTPSAFDARVAELDGVKAGGLLWLLNNAAAVSTTIDSQETFEVPFYAASPGLFEAAHAELGAGRIYDSQPINPSAPQVVLGPRVAEKAGITALSPGLSVALNGRLVVVVGILSTSGTTPELGNAIIASPETAQTLVSPTSFIQEQSAIVRTELGAASVVSQALPALIRPSETSRVGLLVPPDLSTLRTEVQGSLNGLALGIAGFSVVVGAVGIMNSMLISVSQRASEIGLRRAMGATRVWVLIQFLLEGAVLGFIGSTFGIALAVIALWAVSWVNNWTPVLHPLLPVVTPLLGALIGVVSAVYPSYRAATLSPSATLKS